MSKFKGYAQSSGFKTIQLPDTTRRIREEGLRTSRRMQQNFQIRRENAQAVLQALNDKYRIEEKNRDLVFNLESENRDQIRNSMVQNAEILRQNNETKIKQTQQAAASLVEFSQSLGENFLTFASAQAEKGREEGAQIANTLLLAGGSYADIEYVRQLDKAHIQNDERYRSIVEKLRSNGTSNEIIDQVRKANASTLYGLQKQLLVNAGLDYDKTLAANEGLPLILADGTESEYTLGQARLMGSEYTNLVENQEIRNRANYIAQYQGKENDPMVARYLYPKLIEAERANARAQAAERSRKMAIEDELTYLEGFRTRHLDGGHASNMQFLQQSSNKRTARQAMLKSYADMVKAGAWGTPQQAWDEYVALKDQDVVIGDSPPQKFGELYKRDPNLLALESAIASYREDYTGRREKAERDKKQRLETELLVWGLAQEEGSLDDNLIREVLSEAKSLGLDTDRINAVFSDRSNDELFRRNIIPILDEQIENGTFTINSLDGITDKVILDRYEGVMDDLKEEEKFLRPTERVRSTFAAELANAIDVSDYNGQTLGSNFEAAVDHAMREYHLRMGRPDPTTGRSDQQRKIIADISAEIQDHENPNSSYLVYKPLIDIENLWGPRAKFLRFIPTEETYIRPDLGRLPQHILRDIKDDNDYPLNNVVMPKGQTQIIAEAIKRQKYYMIPQFVHDLSEVTGHPAYQIINSQFKLHGIDFAEAKPGLVDNVRSSLTEAPELMSILSTASAQNINTVVAATGNHVPFVRKGSSGYQDVVSLARTNQFKAPNVMAAMWALETGYGQSVLGSNALFNVKSKDGTGTRRIVTEFDASGRPYKTSATFANFDTPAQAVQNFIQTISKYPGVEEATTPRELITAIANGGYATDPSYIQKVSGVLNDNGVNLDEPFIQYNGPINRDPTFSSSTLKHVYNVGGLGWGSTGSHLDMKQVDNPNTPENEEGSFYEYNDPELREYIFVDDKELGMVPLSDVPMTGNWQSHTNRGSNGYDYGIHDGRGIFIKPPARVINVFRTSQGDDMMIIELPSGRRFKWHHGRRVG